MPQLATSPEIDLTQTPLPAAVLGTHASDVASFAAAEPAGPPNDSFPKVGDDFFGFELIEELGCGAFGRVFSARQRELSNRVVVLKITLKPNGEPLRLAKLQHTNIVPIQNAFRRGPYHVVQMPYFGRQTLADVIHHVRTQTGFPEVGGEVFTTVARASTQLSSRPDSSPFKAEPVAVPVAETGAEAFEPHALRDLLQQMPYPEAVLTVVRRLTDGLAHAHARNILHLDIKPANVLFGDDGQPMLLDFNLSADRSAGRPERVGGTWPYMAPEVLRAYTKTSQEVPDERTDLYALGVIFFELLTCRLPFAPFRRGADGLTAAIAERTAGAPPVRDFNPSVPTAVEAVVRKLLAPDPADRYQTADQLRQDLRRQLENRPLLFAPDRHPLERLWKWRKRNPHLLGHLAIVFAVVGLSVGGYGLRHARQESARAVAVRQAEAFAADLTTARVDLSVPSDSALRTRGIRAMTDWLARYHAGDRPEWATTGEFASLDDARRAELLRDVGEAALLVAHAEIMQARGAEAGEQANALKRAVRWNRVGEQSFPAGVPAIGWEQRAKLADLTADEELRASIPTRPAGETTPIDLMLRAAREIGDGDFAAAIADLTDLTEQRPGHYAGHFLLAMSYQQTGRRSEAFERFQVAKPLAPADPRPAFQAATIWKSRGKAQSADAELTAALAKDPHYVPARRLRAEVRATLGRHDDAVADFTKALADGGPAIPLHLGRAVAYANANKPAEAAADRAAADRLKPQTAEEYTARADGRVPTDPAAALRDYDQATNLDPLFIPAWHNKACLLAQPGGNPDEAMHAIARAVELVPRFAPSLALRAVLLARQRRRADALDDITTALLGSSDPEITYQAACVYALTGDADQALNHFRQSLRDGFPHLGLVKGDADLKPVIGDPRFLAVLDAAVKLAAK